VSGGSLLVPSEQALGSVSLAVEEGEFQVGFGDDFAVDEAAAGGLADVAADFGGFGFGDEGVAGHDWFAPFDIVRAEEVADFSEVLGFTEHEDG